MIWIEDFKEIGTLDGGELVMKFPGTDIKMLYGTGRAFLNELGIGYVKFTIKDIRYDENGEAEGLMGILGRKLAEQIKDPATKLILKKFLFKKDQILCYSKGQDGVEILCIPGMSGEYNIDNQTIPNMVVATYSIKGEIPNIEVVYAHHIKAIGNRKLITDKNILKKEVLQLVQKANKVYEIACDFVS